MPKTKNTSLNIAFFGTPDRAVYVLDELKTAGIIPQLVVTQPDRPQGRKLIMTAPATKVWAQKENIPVLQPENVLDTEFVTTLKKGEFDVFVVVAYGKILPKEILDIPKHGSLNLHASLLPLLRGSCPIETAILMDMKETGVTIIKMDEKMDHGPIIASKKATLTTWPMPAHELAQILVKEGGKLFAEILPRWIEGKIKATEQNHTQATYTKKIVKEDGELDLSDNNYKNYLKYNAYKGWPGTFFFKDIQGKKTRINISDATFDNNTFTINKVIPEGKKEMLWKDFVAK